MTSPVIQVDVIVIIRKSLRLKVGVTHVPRLEVINIEIFDELNPG